MKEGDFEMEQVKKERSAVLLELEKKMSEEVLSGKRQGLENNTSGLNRYIYDYGVYIRYNDPEALQ